MVKDDQRKNGSFQTNRQSFMEDDDEEEYDNKYLQRKEAAYYVL